MLIDGEKWACEACVRGHRVSNCQHSDRPLQHINKKGRPVSQCQHCRSVRKSRSSHVKCDCGEKSHKCMHLKGAAEGHKESCCCNHGGRCTCAHKRDQPLLDPVPESDESDQEPVLLATSKGSVRGRRRANTIHSDGAILTFDENGHHKPTYKHPRAHETCGPYQLNRVHSLHGASGLANRSVDNLLRFVGLDDDGSISSPASSSGAAHDQRKTRSETASPLMTGTSKLAHLDGPVPPLDMSATECSDYVASPFDFIGSISDNEQPLFSAGLSTSSDDWSNYEGLDFANKAADTFTPSSYSQPQSLGGLECHGLPPMTTTTSNSGDLSEPEDFLPAGATDPLEFESVLRNSTASTGFDLAQAQAELLASTNLANIDWEQFKLVKEAADKYLPTPASLAADEPALLPTDVGNTPVFSLPEEEPAFWMMPDAGMPSIWEMQ